MTSILECQIHFVRCSRSKLESFEALEPFESNLQLSTSSPFRLQRGSQCGSAATKLEMNSTTNLDFVRDFNS